MRVQCQMKAGLVFVTWLTLGPHVILFTKDSRGFVNPLTQVAAWRLWRSGYKSLLGNFSDERVKPHYYLALNWSLRSLSPNWGRAPLTFQEVGYQLVDDVLQRSVGTQVKEGVRLMYLDVALRAVLAALQVLDNARLTDWNTHTHHACTHSDKQDRSDTHTHHACTQSDKQDRSDLEHYHYLKQLFLLF